MARPSNASVVALSIYAAIKKLCAYVLSGVDDDAAAYVIDVNVKQTSGVTSAMGTGVVGATVPRVTIASDDAEVTDIHTLSLAVSSSRVLVNPIVGQAGIAAGAGAVGATVPRVTLASDDPAVASLAILDDLAFAEDAAHVSADKGVQLLTVQKAIPVDTAGTDGDYQPLTSKTGRLHVSDRPIGTPAFGVSSARFTSNDASGAAVAVTDAPVSTQKLVIDGILISSATDVRLDFTCETSGVLIASLWLLAKTSFYWQPRTVIKLATADKKLFVQASAAAVIYVTTEYHSEA